MSDSVSRQRSSLGSPQSPSISVQRNWSYPGRSTNGQWAVSVLKVMIYLSGPLYSFSILNNIFRQFLGFDLFHKENKTPFMFYSPVISTCRSLIMIADHFGQSVRLCSRSKRLLACNTSFQSIMPPSTLLLCYLRPMRRSSARKKYNNLSTEIRPKSLAISSINSTIKHSGLWKLLEAKLLMWSPPYSNLRSPPHFRHSKGSDLSARLSFVTKGWTVYRW